MAEIQLLENDKLELGVGKNFKNKFQYSRLKAGSEMELWSVEKDNTQKFIEHQFIAPLEKINRNGAEIWLYKNNEAIHFKEGKVTKAEKNFRR